MSKCWFFAHHWGKWYDGYSAFYQFRKCEKCGKKQSRVC